MDKQKEDAAWDDMDWGLLESAEPEVASASVRVEIPESVSMHREPETPAVHAPVVSSPQHDAPLGPPPRPKQAAVAAAPQVFTGKSTGRLIIRDEVGQVVAETTVTDHVAIGRHRTNELILKDLRVSSYHARIVARPDGAFDIIDLNSTGGTFVNGEKIAKQTLVTGDEIIFANVVGEFVYVAGSHLEESDEIGGTVMVSTRDLAERHAAQVPHAPEFKLLVPQPTGVAKEFPLIGDARIGRIPDNDIVIQDEHVSGYHARLLRSPAGAFEVLDLQSTCGTKVNGDPVLTKLLAPGDRVCFGFVECLFERI